MSGRTDVEKYASACSDMTNFLPVVQGAAIKRPGTRYVSTTKNSAKVWLQSFIFNYQQAFILEFGVGYVRFYNNYSYLSCGTPTAWSGATAYTVGDLSSRSGVNYYCILGHTNHQPPNSTYWYALTSDIYEIPTPYTEDDLTTSEGTFGLSLVQSADIIYIASRNHLPKKLSRFANTDWTLTDIATAKSPFATGNTDKTHKITVDGLTTFIGSDFEEYAITLESNFDYFDSDMIGTNLQFTVTDDPVIKPWAGQLGTGKHTTVGDIIRNDNKYYGCNSAIGGTQTWYVSPIHTEGGQWDGDEISWWYLADQNGVIKITSVTNATTAAGTVIRQVANTGSTTSTLTSVTIDGALGGTLTSAATMDVTNNGTPGELTSPSDISGAADIILTGNITPVFTTTPDTDDAVTWAFAGAAWNDTDGYPTHVTLFRDRLVFARDQTLWFSVSADYENFSAMEFGQVLTDSAITVSVPFEQVSQINYIVPTKTGLLVGSTDGEAIVTSGTNAEPFGADNIKIDLTTRYGSRYIQPLRVDDAVIFVQRAGKKVRESLFDINTDNVIANDLTLFADGVTGGGILDITFQREPYNVLWSVRNDGVLLGFTYNRSQSVTGWHMHKLGGSFDDTEFGIVESVRVLPSYDGSRDDLWLVVKRTINGNSVRFIEYMSRVYDSTIDIQDNAYYVDAGSTYDGAATDTITGATWLPNTEVAVLANGAIHPNVTTDGSGTLTTDYDVTIAQVGLEYVSTLATMRLDGGSDQGTAQGKFKKLTEVMLRVYNTNGLEIGTGEGSYPYQEVDLRNTDTAMGSPTPLFSGDITTVIDSPITEECIIKLKSSNPLPVTVIALSPVVEVYDK